MIAAKERQGPGFRAGVLNNIVVRLNNCATNDPCALCGERTDPLIGPELFLSGTLEVICWTCGRNHAPELAAMIEEHNRRLYGDEDAF